MISFPYAAFNKWKVLLALLTLLIATPAMSSEKASGSIIFVKGTVEVVRGGQTLTAKKDMTLYEGDIVVAKEGALAEIWLADKGSVVVKGDTRVKIADLLGSKEPHRLLWTKRVWAKVRGVLKKEETGQEVSAGLKAAEAEDVGELEGGFMEDQFEEKPVARAEETKEATFVNPPDEVEIKEAIRELEATLKERPRTKDAEEALYLIRELYKELAQIADRRLKEEFPDSKYLLE
jgi:hypothetical protein